MKRGEIYYLDIPEGTTTGCEIKYDRPAIVVSCDNLLRTGSTATVVPCSSSPRSSVQYGGLRCHVPIASTARECHALVEQITTVDKSRLRRCLGETTPDELVAIDTAIASYLSLPLTQEDAPEADVHAESAQIVRRDEWCEEEQHTAAQFVPKAVDREADALRTELEVYKHLYGDLLSRMMRGA